MDYGCQLADTTAGCSITKLAQLIKQDSKTILILVEIKENILNSFVFQLLMV